MPPPLPTLQKSSIVKQRVAFSEIAKSQKKIDPCLRLWARGRPHFCLFASPQARGMARRQGAAWIAPGWNGLGVKRHAPRLAARQRGILAFMPLTVVGPGRLL